MKFKGLIQIQSGREGGTLTFNGVCFATRDNLGSYAHAKLKERLGDIVVDYHSFHVPVEVDLRAAGGGVMVRCLGEEWPSTHKQLVDMLDKSIKEEFAKFEHSFAVIVNSGYTVKGKGYEDTDPVVDLRDLLNLRLE